MNFMLIKLYFWAYRKFNDLPSRLEANHALVYKHTARIHWALEWYGRGYTLEEIAKLEKVTRERVRQMIMKGCRTADTERRKGQK